LPLIGFNLMNGRIGTSRVGAGAILTTGKAGMRIGVAASAPCEKEV
jgi:hypothetical protein